MNPMPAGYNRYRVHFGIEIETGLRTTPATLKIGSYHRGLPIKEAPGWVTETDCTVHSRGTNVEFVGGVFKNKARMVKKLKQLLHYANRNSENFVFNDSMGGHVHFSLYDHRAHKYLNIHNFVGLEQFTALRDALKQSISASFTSGQLAAFLTQYNRSMARTINTLQQAHQERHSEFNLTETSTGMEWRSINLQHCTTNEDIIKTYSIVYDVLESILVPSVRKRKHCFKTIDEIRAIIPEAGKKRTRATVSIITSKQEIKED